MIDRNWKHGRSSFHPSYFKGVSITAIVTFASKIWSTHSIHTLFETVIHFRNISKISCEKISMKIAILMVILCDFLRHVKKLNDPPCKGATRVQCRHTKIMVHKMPHKCNSCTIFVGFFFNLHILVNYLRFLITKKAHRVE